MVLHLWSAENQAIRPPTSPGRSIGGKVLDRDITFPKLVDNLGGKWAIGAVSAVAMVAVAAIFGALLINAVTSFTKDIQAARGVPSDPATEVRAIRRNVLIIGVVSLVLGTLMVPLMSHILIPTSIDLGGAMVLAPVVYSLYWRRYNTAGLNAKTHTVLVVDHEMPVRAGWAAVIRAAPGLVVVGEAADGEEAVARAADTHPDVVVMGTRAPSINGMTATERIRAGADSPKVIILGPPDLHEQFHDALRAGASGLLMRDVPPEQLLVAILAVAAGHVLLAPWLADQMSKTSVAGGPGPSPTLHIGSSRSWAGADQLVFARDVHDVLGRTLAAINRKSELVARLLIDQPDRARAELETVRALTRRSIAEVRALAGGYRLGDLAAEIEGARSNLQLMGLRVEVGGSRDALPRAVQEAFGWVVREASANVIQHSSAAFCSIEVWTRGRTAHLRIINDGAAQRGSAPGTGLAGLTTRLRTIGGTLTHGPGSDLTYRVEAAAPVGW